MSTKKKDKTIDELENRDPITGAPGAHPVGTGAGATAGGITGAVAGSVGGPIGAAAGMAAGAVAGGWAGKEIAESFDPTIEDEYWRTEYPRRSYYDPDYSYDVYRPAYRVGYEGYFTYPGMTYEQAEGELRDTYVRQSNDDSLSWEKAKLAVRDGWDRVKNLFSDEDGK